MPRLRAPGYGGPTKHPNIHDYPSPKIAYASGFSDRSHFMGRFREIEGRTPTIRAGSGRVLKCLHIDVTAISDGNARSEIAHHLGSPCKEVERDLRARFPWTP